MAELRLTAAAGTLRPPQARASLPSEAAMIPRRTPARNPGAVHVMGLQFGRREVIPDWLKSA